MLRARRGKVWGVGPRSAHIAGLPYACFTDATRLDGARPVDDRPSRRRPRRLRRPRAGRRHPVRDHAHLRGERARRSPSRDDYCWADPARRAPRARPRRRGTSASTVTSSPGGCSGPAARRSASSCTLVATSSRIKQGVVVAVGGGAGGLGRHVAQMMGYECVVPDRAEVISSIGDALSLIRAERERTVHEFDPRVARQLAAEVENEVVAAGAAPTSVEVLIEEQPDKGTVRAVATGAIGLQAGARPGRPSGDRGRGPHGRRAARRRRRPHRRFVLARRAADEGRGARSVRRPGGRHHRRSRRRARRRARHSSTSSRSTEAR